MYITITIDSSIVFDAVKEMVEYYGAKNGDYSNFIATDEDESMLLAYVDAAVTRLKGASMRYFTTSTASTTDGVTTYSISLDMPSNYVAGYEAMINDAAYKFVNEYTFEEWLHTVGDAGGDARKAVAEDLYVKLQEEISLRTRPTTTTVSPDNPFQTTASSSGSSTTTTPPTEDPSGGSATPSSSPDRSQEEGDQ